MSVNRNHSSTPQTATFKKTRLRKRLRACLSRSHSAETKSEATTHEARRMKSAVEIPTDANTPRPGHCLDVTGTNHSWTDTEAADSFSTKLNQSMRKRRQLSSPPCSSLSSASSSSSTSSTFSVAKKGVTYGCDGALVSCRFCEILESGDETFLYEDEDVVVFRPLAPVVVSHILVVPRRHIRDVNKLTLDDAALLHHMREAAATVLREMPRPSVMLAPSKTKRACEIADDCTDEEDFESDFKFAFHSPPFNSIDHVHMHAFRTRDGRFGCVGSIKYRTETWWCRSLDEILNRLKLRNHKREADADSRVGREGEEPPMKASQKYRITNESMVLTLVESLGEVEN